MLIEFPNEKPAFLFNDDECYTYAIGTKVFQKLLKKKGDAEEKLKHVTQTNKELLDKNKSLKVAIENTGAPGVRAKTSYLNIIAALLHYIQGDLHGIDSHTSFTSETNLINAIIENFPNVAGLSPSNLHHKFPEAKQSIQASRS